MGGPTSSYATTGIALRVIGVLKPPHHDKVETLRGGAHQYLQYFFYSFYSFFTAVISTSILSHTIRSHLFISTYVAKLVAGTIL